MDEENYRQLSELQHFAFCRRQWGLIHIEQQWADNLRTAEGTIMHKRVHDNTKTELRGDVLIVRGMKVKSDKYQIVGICDAVEFLKDERGISLFGRAGKWLPVPVEYKRGRPKSDISDELQLCGQALCLEEMLCCRIDTGYIYYGETRHRTEISFTDSLRNQVRVYIQEMMDYAKKEYTPKVKPNNGCNSCSLKSICLPEIIHREEVNSYYSRHLKEIE